jgi:hypothetical protein
MTTAQARVEQRVIITGVDDASAAIKKVQDSLKKMDGQVVQTSKTLAKVDPAERIKDTSGDVESALKGLSDFAGGASEEVSKVGDAFGATEAVIRLIPGPLGLATAGVIALTAASVLLFQKWQTDSNKLNLLTDPQTRTLGDSLGFGADQTVKLQAALNNLTTASRPPQAALAQVAANAEAIGGDPADAVVKFIGAWEKGPEAVRAMRAEIGAITAGLITLPDIARDIGLDPETIGLTQAATAADDLKATLTDVQSIRAQYDASVAKANDAEAKRRDFANRESAAEIQQLANIRDSERANARIIKERLDQAAEYAKQQAVITTASKQTQDVIKRTADIQQDADLLAQLSGDKKIASGIRLDALDEKRATLLAHQAALLKTQAETGSELVGDALRLLGLEIQRTDLAAKAIKDADAAERKAKAKEAASKANARRAKELAEANKVAEGRVRLAIEAAEREAKAFDDMVDRQQAGYNARAKASESAGEAIRQTELLQLEGNAKIQDALGNADKAAELRLQAEVKRRDAEIEAINKTIAARRKEAQNRSIDILADLSPDEQVGEKARAEKELTDIEAEGQALRTAAELKSAQERQKLLDEERQRELAKIAEQGQNVANAIRQSSSLLQKFGGTSGKVGNALDAVAGGVTAVTGNWGDLKKAAPGAIDAVGGVATAFVESEKSKATILAIMEAAHAVASFAAGDYVGAASHTVAAALYGGVAGGLIGGASGSAGAPSAAAPALTGSGAGGGGTNGGNSNQPVTQVVNFTGLFATKQQVGKAMQESQRSLKKTGLATVRGT